MKTVNEAVYRLSLEPGSYEQNASKVEQANRKLVVSGEKLVVAEEKVTAATRITADGFSRLEARYDPLIRLEQRRTAALAQAERYYESGRVGMDRYTAQVDRINAAIDRQVAQLRRLGTANDNARGMAGRFGSTMQMAGYQIGDFAVQVASGQGVLRPLIQQGSQLVSAFGPWGAVLGAAGAVVGALATSLFDASDASKSAKSATEEFSDAIDASNALLLTNNELTEYRTQKSLESAKAKLQEALATQTSNYATAQEIKLKLQERQQLATDLQNLPRGLAQQAGRTIARDLEQFDASKLDQQIDEATRNIEKLLQQYEALENPQNLGQAREKRIKAENDALAEQAKRLEMIRKNDADLAAQQDRDRAAAQERGRKIIEADIEAARKLEDKAARERERELEQYQKKLAQTIQHTTDRLVDFAGNSIFDRLTGRVTNFWDTFKDYGLRMISQLAAEMAIRPLATALTPDIAGDEPIQGMLRA